jgi:integrase
MKVEYGWNMGLVRRAKRNILIAAVEQRGFNMRPAKHILKARDVDKARATDSVIEYRIEGVPGMTLRVEAAPSAVAAYYVLFRASGQKRRIRLGRRGLTPYEQAKSRALEIMAAVERGEDPYVAVKEAQCSLTFAEVWEQRKADNVDLAPSTLQQYDIMLNRYALKDIGAMKADEVTDGHVRALLDNVRDGKRTIKVNSYNAVLAAIGSTYAWARGSTLGVRAKPTDLIDPLPTKPPRHRNLTDNEVAAIWNAIGTAEGIRPEVRLLLRAFMLTGQRNANLSEARVEWIPALAVENPTLFVPARFMKRKDDHQLPLTPAAAKLFREARQLNPGSEFFFAQNEKRASSLTRDKAAEAMQKVCAAAGVHDVHIHDWRHVITTWLAERGTPSDVRKKITHHAPAGVHDKVYNSAKLREPVRAALQQWAEFVEGVARAAGSSHLPNNVTALPHRDASTSASA